jgi:hypothetical protein
MANNTTDPVITMSGLSYFWNNIKEKFLTKTTADGIYAAKEGNPLVPFNVSELNLNNDSGDKAHITIVRPTEGITPIIVMGLEGEDPDQIVTMTLLSNAVKDKANSVTASNGVTYCVNPIPQVFTDAIMKPEGQFRVELKGFNVGDILHYTNGSGSQGSYRVTGFSSTGFYLVKSVELDTVTEVEFICNTTKYTLYYCINEAKYYIWNGVTFTDITPSSTVIPGSDDETYQPATEQQINEIIGLI